jgi:hypothetical protein
MPSMRLAVFAVRDRITGSDGPVQTVIVGATQSGEGSWKLLRDWELIKLLNPLADKPRSQVLAAETRMDREVMDILAAAQQHVESQLGQLDLPFKLSTVERLACLVPGAPELAALAASIKRCARRRFGAHLVKLGVGGRGFRLTDLSDRPIWS